MVITRTYTHAHTRARLRSAMAASTLLTHNAYKQHKYIHIWVGKYGATMRYTAVVYGTGASTTTKNALCATMSRPITYAYTVRVWATTTTPSCCRAESIFSFFIFSLVCLCHRRHIFAPYLEIGKKTFQTQSHNKYIKYFNTNFHTDHIDQTAERSVGDFNFSNFQRKLTCRMLHNNDHDGCNVRQFFKTQSYRTRPILRMWGDHCPDIIHAIRYPN